MSRRLRQKSLRASGYTPFPRGHISGLGTSNAGNTITIAVGECRTGTSSDRSLADARLRSAFTKVLGATWAEGSGGNGLGTGSPANNTWYHLFIISQGLHGKVDFGFDTDINAANLMANATVIAAGYTNFRRIGSMRTDGAATIINYTQTGDEFRWSDAPGLESSSDADHSGGSTITLTRAPTGFKKLVHLIGVVAFTGGSNRVLMVGTDEAAAAGPGVFASPLANFRYDGASSLAERQDLSLLLGTSNTVVFRASTATTIQLHTETKGWRDARGEFD